MTDIFLSRPTWVEKKFQKGLEQFLSLLRTLELNPHTLGATDYPNLTPLDEVISLMEKCKGAIILGYPQITVKSGFLKKKKLEKTMLLPTEWNHIEAGLAYARALPLLVIHHSGVVRGIFDRGAINTFNYEKDLSESDWALSPEISGALSKWKKDVLSNDLQNEDSEALTLNEPTCPNCSTRKRKIYLSPIPSEFREIENATHECSKCGYKREKI